MEISAIMNIHELALNRHIKQKVKGLEATNNSKRMIEQIDLRMPAAQQGDMGEVTQENKHITGHKVNIVT